MKDNEIEVLRNDMYYKIVGCAYRSYDYFHWGVDELTYEAGLKAELEELGFKVHRQQDFPIYYKGKPTEVSRRMDLVVEHPILGFVIVELKAMDFISDMQRKQLWSYMKLLNNRYGMLINFSPKGVYYENWVLGDTISAPCVRV